MFFATPHRGYNFSGYFMAFSALRKAASKFMFGIVPAWSTWIFKSPRKDSPILQAILDDFPSHVKDIKIATFYETKITYPPEVMVSVPAQFSSANIDCGETER
jgi:hypothetical protein